MHVGRKSPRKARGYFPVSALSAAKATHNARYRNNACAPRIQEKRDKHMALPGNGAGKFHFVVADGVNKGCGFISENCGLIPLGSQKNRVESNGLVRIL